MYTDLYTVAGKNHQCYEYILQDLGLSQLSQCWEEAKEAYKYFLSIMRIFMRIRSG